MKITTTANPKYTPDGADALIGVIEISPDREPVIEDAVNCKVRINRRQFIKAINRALRICKLNGEAVMRHHLHLRVLDAAFGESKLLQVIGTDDRMVCSSNLPIESLTGEMPSLHLRTEKMRSTAKHLQDCTADIIEIGVDREGHVWIGTELELVGTRTPHRFAPVCIYNAADDYKKAPGGEKALGQLYDLTAVPMQASATLQGRDRQNFADVARCNAKRGKEVRLRFNGNGTADIDGENTIAAIAGEGNGSGDLEPQMIIANYGWRVLKILQGTSGRLAIGAARVPDHCTCTAMNARFFIASDNLSRYLLTSWDPIEMQGEH